MPADRSTLFRSRASQRLAICALLVAGILPLVAFGLLGIGRPNGPINVDGTTFFAAGRAWLSGLNPYSHQDLIRSVSDVTEIDVTSVPFFYPPQTSIFCVVLGLMSYPVARDVWIGTNLLAIAAIAAMAVATLRKSPGPAPYGLGPWIVAAVIFGNPFTSHVVWMGQSSLVATAGILGAWFFSQRHKPVIAGVLLGLATFKPQLCILLFLWFALERNFLVIAVAVATSALMSLYAMIAQGPLGAWLVWREGVKSGYATVVFNSPGFQNKVGLESLFSASGVPVPGMVFTLLGAMLTLGLWMARDRVREGDVLALLVAITFVFVGYSHDYDYVGLAPLWIVAWQQGALRPRAAALLLVLNVLMFLPQRFVRPFHIAALTHWRTPLLLVLGITLLAVSRMLQAERATAGSPTGVAA
jgi:hypothetical protein